MRRSATCSRLAAFLTLTLAAALPGQGPVAAKPAKRATPPAPAASMGQPALTSADVGAFFDAVMPMQLEREDIAGAVVLVVKDGRVLFAKGYGWSDMKQRTPVTVDATLFRIGSISKTFTWTAVMQLVEQGKLDLDKDVNAYLDFTIPASFGKPVTMRQLMTHSAGFEETLKDLFVRKPADLTSLGEYMKTHLPRQIFAPGTVPAYSNYGATLAGYIVQKVSGMPFDDYIQKNLLAPLGMTRTTFAQPLPDSLKPFMATGYAKASGKAKDFEVVQAWPAGSVAASAENMSHWMIAHLQDGAYGDARILQAATARQMHSRIMGLAPELNGMCYGFYEESRNGRRIIGHGGDTQWFHSDMHLMPDDHVGFFISYNSAGKGEISPRTEIWRAFLDRYFPYTPPAMAVLKTAAQDARSVAGTYETSRRQESSVMNIASTLGETTIHADSDGTLRIGARDFAGNEKHFEEVGPLLFREVHGQDRVKFLTDATGRTMAIGDVHIVALQRSTFMRHQNLNLAALIGGLAVFVITLLSWPLNAILRKHYRARPELSAAYRRTRMLVRVAMILNVAFAAFWLQTLSSIGSDIGMLSSNRDALVRAFQVLGALGLVGLLHAIWLAVRSWRERPLWLWARIWNTLLAVAFAAFAFFIVNARLLDFSLHY